jgi:hypothetical protein
VSRGQSVLTGPKDLVRFYFRAAVVLCLYVKD